MLSLSELFIEVQPEHKTVRVFFCPLRRNSAALSITCPICDACWIPATKEGGLKCRQTRRKHCTRWMKWNSLEAVVMNRLGRSTTVRKPHNQGGGWGTGEEQVSNPNTGTDGLIQGLWVTNQHWQRGRKGVKMCRRWSHVANTSL